MMNPAIKKRLIRTALLCVIAFGIGATVALMERGGEESNSTAVKKPSIALGGVKMGGDFAALNQDGEPVRQDILSGQYTLVYFGFTYCPAICPTELQKIAHALKTLEQEAPALAEKIQPVFISIDPERDTPEVLKEYVPMFHPRMIGITGSVAQIDHIKSLYKIYARKVQEEGMEADEYTMDHSSYIYLLDPNGELLSLYRIEDKAEQIIEDIKTYAAP